ncbi:hypothetical protein AURDEDRAFT_177417 [Auricularia subglabra TFB-10046 SS5]|uniref:Uncharacterized protein n=1 Tax=Auricularia subglabra (strain TFB-10046 / SS5) TaxID=717982 RepID=J0WNT3_AURST|nr:hypothetical protein AURDEDRAFT_177417 [Auricularia subglabra TFB-10046 SS5]
MSSKDETCTRIPPLSPSLLVVRHSTAPPPANFYHEHSVVAAQDAALGQKPLNFVDALFTVLPHVTRSRRAAGTGARRRSLFFAPSPPPPFFAATAAAACVVPTFLANPAGKSGVDSSADSGRSLLDACWMLAVLTKVGASEFSLTLVVHISLSGAFCRSQLVATVKALPTPSATSPTSWDGNFARHSIHLGSRALKGISRCWISILDALRSKRRDGMQRLPRSRCLEPSVVPTGPCYVLQVSGLRSLPRMRSARIQGGIPAPGAIFSSIAVPRATLKACGANIAHSPSDRRTRALHAKRRLGGDSQLYRRPANRLRPRFRVSTAFPVAGCVTKANPPLPPARDAHFAGSSTTHESTPAPRSIVRSAQRAPAVEARKNSRVRASQHTRWWCRGLAFRSVGRALDPSERRRRPARQRLTRHAPPARAPSLGGHDGIRPAIALASEAAPDARPDRIPPRSQGRSAGSARAAGHRLRGPSPPSAAVLDIDWALRREWPKDVQKLAQDFLKDSRKTS